MSNLRPSFAEIDYDDDDIECNLSLLDGAVLSATSSLNERGPENARLNGESPPTHLSINI